MSQPEQLHATRIRIARETAVGSGIATGGWYSPPMTAAAVAREIKQQATRRSVHRGPVAREIVSEAWTLATGHEVGLPFLALLLTTHLTERDTGEFTLDPETPEPTWVIETTSEGGDIALFSGAAISELRIGIEERKTVKLDVKWEILRRTVETTAAAGATNPSLAGRLIATNECALAATTTEWSELPDVYDLATMHAAQIYLSRKIIPGNYGPDGIPTAHDPAPWNVVGEIFMPETAGITDTAFQTTWAGKLAFWIGADLSLWIHNAAGVVTDEDLLAWDWRVRRIAFEAQGDARRALLEVLA